MEFYEVRFFVIHTVSVLVVLKIVKVNCLCSRKTRLFLNAVDVIETVICTAEPLPGFQIEVPLAN